MIALFLTLCMAFALAVPAGAVDIGEDSAKRVLSDGTVVEDDAIILRDMEDIERMIEEDELQYDREYASKLSQIDTQLQKDFSQFSKENKETNFTCYDEVIDAFLRQYRTK